MDFVLYEIIFVMFHFEITQPRGDRSEFCYVGALKGCELNTGAQSFDLFSEADHTFNQELLQYGQTSF